MVREMISPKVDLVLTIPPASTINIAIHIREGGGYDTDHTQLRSTETSTLIFLY